MRQDVLEAIRKYHDVSPRLAEEFDVELKGAIAGKVTNAAHK